MGLLVFDFVVWFSVCCQELGPDLCVRAAVMGCAGSKGEQPAADSGKKASGEKKEAPPKPKGAFTDDKKKSPKSGADDAENEENASGARSPKPSKPTKGESEPELKKSVQIVDDDDDESSSQKRRAFSAKEGKDAFDIIQDDYDEGATSPGMLSPGSVGSRNRRSAQSAQYSEITSPRTLPALGRSEPMANDSANSLSSLPFLAPISRNDKQRADRKKLPSLGRPAPLAFDVKFDDSDEEEERRDSRQSKRPQVRERLESGQKRPARPGSAHGLTLEERQARARRRREEEEAQRKSRAQRTNRKVDETADTLRKIEEMKADQLRQQLQHKSRVAGANVRERNQMISQRKRKEEERIRRARERAESIRKEGGKHQTPEEIAAAAALDKEYLKRPDERPVAAAEAGARAPEDGADAGAAPAEQADD